MHLSSPVHLVEMRGRAGVQLKRSNNDELPFLCVPSFFLGTSDGNRHAHVSTTQRPDPVLLSPAFRLPLILPPLPCLFNLVCHRQRQPRCRPPRECSAKPPHRRSRGKPSRRYPSRLGPHSPSRDFGFSQPSAPETRTAARRGTRVPKAKRRIPSAIVVGHRSFRTAPLADRTRTGT